MKNTIISKSASLILILFGLSVTVISSQYFSSYLAVIGFAIILLGIIVLYITPVPSVPLKFLSVVTESNNLERILSQNNLIQKGVYLPPKNLKYLNSFVIFVPKSSDYLLPIVDELGSNKLWSSNQAGIFLTPPGANLARLIEGELGYSILRKDFSQIEKDLKRVISNYLAMAKDIAFLSNEKRIKVVVTDNIFSFSFEQVQGLPHVKEQIGSHFASALACILSKASGKPVSVIKESLRGKKHYIELEIGGN